MVSEWTAERREKYPKALREAADLLEAGNIAKVNLAALIEIAEYIRQEQVNAFCELLRTPGRGASRRCGS